MSEEQPKDETKPEEKKRTPKGVRLVSILQPAVTASVVVGHTTYTVDTDGVVFVDPLHVDAVKHCGFQHG